ncbi:hypothetical protein SOJ17_001142 [Metallosphaera sedula DSM 5348]|uniref:hypothetical protein n=1 Tax=Metallosphaera sedula TaxID=43687 RepID=UPI003089FA48|nr:hypothetical protein SOJ17_001142 [Metallosphaera sedula DSM 5348]
MSPRYPENVLNLGGDRVHQEFRSGFGHRVMMVESKLVFMVMGGVGSHKGTVTEDHAVGVGSTPRVKSR